MKMSGFIFLFFFLCLTCNSSEPRKMENNNVPMVSFTFDDGITRDYPDYPFEEWNEKILKALEQANLKAIFFVTGFNKLDEKGKYLLDSWDERGHRIANHTFSHPNFNDEQLSIDDFEMELLKTDSIIRSYDNFISLFRFPYLKEGNTAEKITGIRNILKKHNYKNGYVTIDASDWYINSRLLKQQKKEGEVDLEKFKAFYLEHLLDRANYYDSLSFQLHQRHIPHTLLLHHNLTSALFLKDLIAHFKDKGWKVMDADKAYFDPVFQQIPNVNPAGESLIWSQAKATGHYDDKLRYPAEDSRYEEARMNQLGL